MKIAIVGSIASGKTTILKAAEQQGCNVFYGDQLIHELYDRPEIREEIIETFQTIDRKELRKIIENSLEEKKKLEDIFSKPLRNRLNELFSEYEKIIVELPLLYEYGYENMFDQVVLVYADEYQQLERLILRNNLNNLDDAYAAINTLPKNDEIIKKVDIILDTDNSVELNVQKLVNLYKN